jgi:solute carrier family 25 (mitochondrial oxoglutarate transporter), member 11
MSTTMLRQMLYSTMRVGLYDILKTRWTKENGGVLPLHRKIIVGLLTGAAVGNPTDVATVRMQADGRCDNLAHDLIGLIDYS